MLTMKPTSKPTTKPQPSALEDHLGFWMRYVSNQVSARFEAELTTHDVSVTEWVALRALYAEAITTHAGLIDALGMTKGAASKIISKLESKDLVARDFVDGGAREQVLRLTSAGRRLVPKLAKLADQNDDYFFAHLGDKKRQALIADLQELVTYHQMKQVPVK